MSIDESESGGTPTAPFRDAPGGGAALLIIDMIGEFDFAGADAMRDEIAAMAAKLPVLLPKLGVDRLILTGIAADICVLFTAADAHMRDYRLWVPADTVVSHSAERKPWALEVMARALDAETRPAAERALTDWLGG